MKKIALISLLVGLTHFVFAQDKAATSTPQKIDGCVYADVVYQVGQNIACNEQKQTRLQKR